MALARLRMTLAGLPLPRTAEEQLVPAVDVSNWLRLKTSKSPDRLFCLRLGRTGPRRPHGSPLLPFLSRTGSDVVDCRRAGHGLAVAAARRGRRHRRPGL
ncbi:transposase [Streptomyces sp. NPDC099088]|uniref:transposase n=1 Tax=Streptomyces sp. NPDC099088 TaxID=3366101 RepID=UPI00380314D5